MRTLRAEATRPAKEIWRMGDDWSLVTRKVLGDIALEVYLWRVGLRGHVFQCAHLCVLDRPDSCSRVPRGHVDTQEFEASFPCLLYVRRLSGHQLRSELCLLPLFVQGVFLRLLGSQRVRRGVGIRGNARDIQQRVPPIRCIAGLGIGAVPLGGRRPRDGFRSDCSLGRS